MTRAFAKVYALALFVPLAFGIGACSKKKPETTPKARAGQATGNVVVSSKGAKMAKCTPPPGTRIITLDLNRDKRRDRWLVVDTQNVKVCHEMDTDYDGKRDLSIQYFNDGLTPRIIWWDLDYDGVWDQVLYNRPDGTKKRVEIRPYPPRPKERKSGKWTPTVWKYYTNIKGKGTVISRIEMDKDRNGFKDYWERYEEGALKEVSWADPNDTDEKPKHWIETPEEGKDKGYGGKDEPPKSPKTDPKTSPKAEKKRSTRRK